MDVKRVKDTPIETIKEAVKNNVSFRGVLKELGLCASNGNESKVLKEIVDDNSISHEHFLYKREEQLYRINQKLVDGCSSYKEVAIKLSILPEDKSMPSRLYTKLKHVIKEKEINIEHFSSYTSRCIGNNYNNRYTHDELFTENSLTSVQTLKKRYLEYREKIGIDYKCDVCGITEWQNEPLKQQIDHINGISNDNRLENIRLICPNCHSQTPTWCRRTPSP